jgi:hypothetical protein
MHELWLLELGPSSPPDDFEVFRQFEEQSHSLTKGHQNVCRNLCGEVQPQKQALVLRLYRMQKEHLLRLV